MSGSQPRRWCLVALFALLVSIGVAHAASAQSAVKVQKADGLVDLVPRGPSPFVLDGTASHLGHFTAHGEIELVPGHEPASLVGGGIVVFTAPNGDQLAGVAVWDLAQGGLGQLHFSWRDSVQFSDGTVVSTTGRFTDNRPPGAFVAVEWTYVLLSVVILAV